MKHIAAAVALVAALTVCTIAVHARAFGRTSRPVVPGAFVKVPHVVASPIAAAPHLSRAEVLAAVASYWPGLAQSTPSSIQFGLVDPRLARESGARKAWVVSYSVNMSPPSGGVPGAQVGPPNIRTMEFIVDDDSGSVLEATGYFD